jgi:hypothetical protein
MSQPQIPKPAKLIISVFTNTTDIIFPAANLLISEFGDIDLVSAWFPFEDTNYYAREMGIGLLRRMIAFRRLIDPGSLADIKHKTNRIEEKFSEQGKRRINIDPGCLTHERFVLATGKNYTHRIYIGSGIFADLTLVYQKGRFQTLPWTYPDYAKENIRSFLMRVRHKYSINIKEESSHDQKHDSLCPV